MTKPPSIAETEFYAVSSAAIDAHRKGDMKQALILDRLARKMNAALTNKKSAGMRLHGSHGPNIAWRQIDGPLKLMGLTCLPPTTDAKQ